MLKRALLNQLFLWDILKLVRHAHGETQVHARSRVDLGGAELDDVPEAFGRTVLAGDAVIVVGVAGDVSSDYTIPGVWWPMLTFQCTTS